MRPIDIITREDIEKTPGVVYLNDLLQKVPGLWAPRFQSGVANDGVYSMRGSEPSSMGVRLMVNGIEMNKGNGYVVAPRIPLHDVERIEVIKAASAEYGDQAVGGIINIVTRLSSEKLEAKIGGSIGTYEYRSGYAVINGSHDKWEYFTDIGFSTREGYQDGTEYRPANLYSRFGYEIDPTMDLELHLSHMRSDGVWPRTLTRTQFEEDPTQSPGGNDTFENDYNLGALVVKKRFGDDELKFTLIGKDEFVTMNFGNDSDGDSWELYPAISYAWREKIGGMDNDLVMGLEYRRHELNSCRFTLSNGVRDTKLSDTLREDDSFGAFLVNKLSITEKLTVTAGLRYDSFEQDQVGRVNSSNNVSQSNDAVSPKAGLTYTFNKGTNFFAGFNSGYKSMARISGYAYSPNLDPERVYSYEAGLRGRPLPWLNYSVAGFMNQYKDKFLKTGPNLTDPYINAGETETVGLELSLNAEFESGIYIDIDYTLQKPEFENYVDSGVQYDGKQLPNIPGQMLGLMAGYRHPTVGQLSVSADFVGDLYFNSDNTLKGDDYWILGASYKKSLTQYYPEFSFFLDVKNLTDAEEVVKGGGTVGNESLVPVNGREFLFGFEVAF